VKVKLKLESSRTRRIRQIGGLLSGTKGVYISSELLLFDIRAMLRRKRWISGNPVITYHNAGYGATN